MGLRCFCEAPKEADVFFGYGRRGDVSAQERARVALISRRGYQRRGEHFERGLRIQAVRAGHRTLPGARRTQR